MNLSIFPTELVTLILIQSDPCDVIRWRTVSKWFCTLTHDITLWRALHVNATFPRLPGPFRKQSRASLEWDLVKSSQLAKSWTTRPLRATSSFRIDVGWLDRYFHSAIRPAQGRWLVTCNDKQLVLHDLDSKFRRHSRRILQEFEQDVYNYNAKSMPCLEGTCSFYVLIVFDDPIGVPNLAAHGWCLLEFCLDCDTGEVLSPPTAITPPMSRLWTVEYALSSLRTGRSRLLLIPTEPILVFDARERVFYELPPRCVALDENKPTVISVDAYELSFVDDDCRTLVTDSHIIYLWHHGAAYVPNSLIQVFMLPANSTPDSNGKRVLRLTHEGHFPKKNLSSARVMHKSTDPVTGTTSIRLLNCCRPGSCYVECTDLVLPEAPVDGVLSISDSIKSRRFSFPQLSEGPSETRGYYYYLDAFYEEPIINGIFVEEPRYLESEKDDSKKFSIVKFTVDLGKDPWVFTCGKKAQLEWAHEEKSNIPRKTQVYEMCLDERRGRISYCADWGPSVAIVADVG